jgi:hypothetical protein
VETRGTEPCESSCPLAPHLPYPPITGSCERWEASQPSWIGITLHRGSLRHCTASPDSICTDEIILYYLITTVNSLISLSLSLSSSFRLITRTPCFISNLRRQRTNLHLDGSMEINNGIRGSGPVVAPDMRGRPLDPHPRR